MIMNKNYFKIFLSLTILIIFAINFNIQIVESATLYQNSTIINTNRGCEFNLKDVPSSEPLYIFNSSRSYKLFKPENLTNLISNNRHLTLNCPGKRNSIIAYNKTLNLQQIQIICQNGNFVNNELGVIEIKNITCDKTPSADVKITDERCGGNHGYIYRIGFNLDSDEFINLFTICYNNQNENTFYSKHIINGKAIQYSIKESKRTSFKSTGMSSGSSKTVQQFYQKNNQNTRFANLFGSDQKYIDNNNFLARGHLTPDADFIFPSAQLATYFYVNVAPEFQIINAGNWKRIENLARSLASVYKTDFEIYTGIHGKLKLLNAKGENLTIFLDDNQKIEIPKWFWKVIQNKKTKDAIVMITLNNPHAIDGKSEEFCTNVCEKAGLNTKEFSNLAKGYTYCCEVKTFRSIARDLPNNFTVSNLLDCSVINDKI